MGTSGRVSALALVGALMLAMTSPPGAQQMACEVEGGDCAAQPSHALTDIRKEMSSGQSDAEDLARAQFQQADTDASGTISPEEWRAWREQTSVDATGVGVGSMPAVGYEARAARAGDSW